MLHQLNGDQMRINGYIEECEFLRDEVIPKMIDGTLKIDLDVYIEESSTCGTFACVAGWYMVLRHGILDDTQVENPLAFIEQQMGEGIPIDIFTSRDYSIEDVKDELAIRLEMLNEYIESLEMEVLAA